jgi:hypothetical protein
VAYPELLHAMCLAVLHTRQLERPAEAQLWTITDRVGTVSWPKEQLKVRQHLLIGG